MEYDAVLLVSFGGPEGPDEVMPFLRNVVRGRGVPDERLLAVAEHYQHFGGVSPINGQCRELLAALRVELDHAGVRLPLYWGNRNWNPFLAETVATMRDDGVRRALAFVTSPFGSYSSCRQYLDDIDAAREQVGPGAPRVDKIRHYHDHPGYVRPHADAVRAALAALSDVEARIVFTAHSIPSSMDAQSGPDGGRYTAQLRETATLVAEEAAPGRPWDLVWQSRSGSPHIPWLEPDINEHLEVPRRGGGQGGGGEPYRLHLRPSRGRLGSGHRGGADRGPAEAGVRPRRHARNRPTVREHDPGSHSGTPRPGRSTHKTR